MTKHPGRRLRELIARPGIALVPGAVDVLGGRVFKEVGFEAIWAGGFMSSASQLGWADANVIGVAEHSRYVANLVLATGLPVLVDVDNGYGNAINVIRAVREMERAGAAGVVIEDQVLPKRCGLFPGTRPIIDTAEMVGKIRAALDARESDEFVIVARTDTFGSGGTVAEAIERAEAYVGAGADVILPISRNLEELEQFAQQQSLSVPIIIAPTLFPHATADHLESLGYSLEIQPTMAAQAMYQALFDAMTTLRDARVPEAYERMMPFRALTDLIGLPEVMDWELKYLPEGSTLQA